VGETVKVPDIAPPGGEKPVPEQDDAPEESQVKTAELPFGIVVLTAAEPFATGNIVETADR
jgi:hypothetical protein